MITGILRARQNKSRIYLQCSSCNGSPFQPLQRCGKREWGATTVSNSPQVRVSYETASRHCNPREGSAVKEERDEDGRLVSTTLLSVTHLLIFSWTELMFHRKWNTRGALAAPCWPDAVQYHVIETVFNYYTREQKTLQILFLSWPLTSLWLPCCFWSKWTSPCFLIFLSFFYVCS